MRNLGLLHVITISMVLAWIPIEAAAQKPIAYPAKGQTAEQQTKDDGECYSWAKHSTGIDPAVVAASPSPAQPSSSFGGGQRLRGAARGAAGGALIGAIAGDAGAGAGIGAVAGTMAGGRQARRDQASSQEQAQAQHKQVMDTYFRAYGACMEGRGYTIR